MLLQTHNLSLKIADRQLVTRLNWQVNAGECWCIIGRNGVGKTTLLRSLAGLSVANVSSGDMAINDQPLNQWSPVELAKIRSYLPQGHNDAFSYRVIETVLGARHPYNDGRYWESDEDVAIAEAALAQLDVADLAGRNVRSLSGGERQRVAIAAVLAQDAQLMLLDEPATALDMSHQISVMNLFSDCCITKNKAILMVSHDLNLACRIATHALLLMDDGSWQAGRMTDTMTEATLSRCLGYPVEMIWHGNQRLFLPARLQ